MLQLDIDLFKINRTGHFCSSWTSSSLFLWQSSRMEDLLFSVSPHSTFLLSLLLWQFLHSTVVTFLIFGLFWWPFPFLWVAGLSLPVLFLFFPYFPFWGPLRIILAEDFYKKLKVNLKPQEKQTKILRFKPQGWDSFKAWKQHGKFQPDALKFSSIPSNWKEGFRAKIPGQCEKTEVVPAPPITVSMQFDGSACSPGSDHTGHELLVFTWGAEAESVTVHFGALLFSSCTCHLLQFFSYNSPSH